MENVNDVINYLKKNNVRMEVVNNLHYFVLIDICKIINIKYNTGCNRFEKLDENQKRKITVTVKSKGGTIVRRKINSINIAGLSSLIHKDIEKNVIAKELYYAINKTPKEYEVDNLELKKKRIQNIDETLKLCVFTSMKVLAFTINKNKEQQKTILNLIYKAYYDYAFIGYSDPVLKFNIYHIIINRLLLNKINEIVKSDIRDDFESILKYLKSFLKDLSNKLDIIFNISNKDTLDVIFENDQPILILNKILYKFDK